MASVQSPLGYRSIHHTIRQHAKAVLVANDMRPSTKRGNREFKIALNRLAMQPYNSLDAAAQVGQELGQKIVDFAKAQNKTNLDAGIIRQMVLTGEIPTVPKTTHKPAKSAQVTVTPPTAKTAKAEPAPAAPVPEALVEAEALAESEVTEADSVVEAPVVEETPEVVAPEKAKAAEPEAELGDAEAEEPEAELETPEADVEPEAEAAADIEAISADTEPPADVEADDAAEAAPEIEVVEDEEPTVPEVTEEKPEPEAAEVEISGDDGKVETTKTAAV